MLEIFDTNLNIFYFLNSFSGKNKFLDYFFIFIAEYLIYILIILFFIYFAKKIWLDKKIEIYEVVLYFSTSVFAWIIAKIIKISIPTERPYHALKNVNQLIFNENNFSSFPSGHSTLSFALAFTLYFYNKKIGIIAIITAILIALGRVFVGVHYPLDILIGGLLGFSIVYIYNKFCVKNNYLKKIFKIKK